MSTPKKSVPSTYLESTLSVSRSPAERTGTLFLKSHCVRGGESC